MRRNQGFILLLWALLIACIGGSLAVLLSGRLHLVGDDAWQMLDRYAKLDAIRGIITEEYYREVDEEALMDGAINGMLAVLEDPYTFYYTPEDMQRRSDALEGVYHGVGMLLQLNDAGEIEVLHVYHDSPAAAAGVQAGDILIGVDGTDVSGVSTQAFHRALEMIQGEDGTQVRLLLDRNGTNVECVVRSGSVASSNVVWSMLEGNVGYIGIFQFSGDAAESFCEALAELQTAGMKGLVVDLRSNPGGIMGDVVAIADELLPEGMIVYTEDKSGERTEYLADGDYCNVPLAVLVNGMSASASEVLAAAVQDTGRGAVIGTQTYGKGVVQAVVSFPEDGSGMQYTISSYYTPSGKSIHKTGVTPDIAVEGDGGQVLSGVPDVAQDVQLQAALAWLGME